MGNTLENIPKIDCCKDNDYCSQLDCLKKENSSTFGNKENNNLQINIEDKGNASFDFEASLDQEGHADEKNQGFTDHNRINSNVENIEIIMDKNSEDHVEKDNINPAEIIVVESPDKNGANLRESELDREQENLGLHNSVKVPINSHEENAKELEHAIDNLSSQKDPELPENKNQIVSGMLSNIGDYQYKVKNKDSKFVSSLEVYKLNKSHFQGETKDNLRQGVGKQVWDDGTTFEGSYKNDMANGNGRMIQSDGNVFIGTFNNNVAMGKGKFTSNFGDSYNGNFIDNLPNGPGELVNAQGDKYHGEFLNGKRSGQGKVEMSTSQLYEGQFQKGKYSGNGFYLWPDGKSYHGDWKHGFMHGHGIYNWPDGKVYEGQYYKGKKHGDGMMQWPNGVVYQGQFQEGMMTGEGILSTKEKKIVEGTFIEGNYIPDY